MFDTITGAKLAAKRLTTLHGIKGGLAREIVARASGYRDWHHLEKAVGTPDAPSGIDRNRLRAYLAEKGVKVAVADIEEAIVPRTEDHIGPLGTLKMQDIVLRGNGHVAYALKGMEAKYATTTAIGDVEVTSIGYDKYIGETISGEDTSYQDEMVLGPPDEFGVPETMSLGHDLFVVEAIERRNEDVVGIATATWYGAGSAETIDVMDLASIIDGCDIGDELALEVISRTEPEVEWGILCIETLTVSPAARRTGVATRLLGAILRTVADRGHTGLVAVDHRATTDGMDQKKACRAVRELYDTRSFQRVLDHHAPGAFLLVMERDEVDQYRATQAEGYDHYRHMADKAVGDWLDTVTFDEDSGPDTVH